jgi:uncharacterized protein YcbK (DUF882 family)
MSEHFKIEDFACKCGCGFDSISPKLIDALEQLRAIIKKPIIINSGCRCANHNKEVGGEKDSKHLSGQAADIHIKGMKPLAVFIKAAEIPAFKQGGRGVYDTFTHVDIGTGNKRPAVWDRRTK